MGSDRLLRRVARVLVVCLHVSLLVPPGWANPQGGTVAAGAAAITASGSTLTVQQSSDKAIINWQSFSNTAGETVRFQQPSATSATLNRVTGVDPSTIAGKLDANGRVYLLNSNGVVFTKTAQVNVGGLVASTLSMKDDDFLSGNHRLTQDPAKGMRAVVNQGTIQTAPGGAVVLAAPVVSNEGTISAPQGKVGLAAGTDVTINLDGAGLINVAARADGKGSVQLPASAAGNPLRAAVNDSNIVEAGSVTEKNGVVTLGGAEGIAVNSGTIRVDGAPGKSGGLIAIHSSRATIASAGALLTANGSGPASNGGDVRLLSHGVTQVEKQSRVEARGGESGNGGSVEVSGKEHVALATTVDTRAPSGKTGTLLIDPVTIRIFDEAITPHAVGISAQSISAQLSDVVLEADNSISVDPLLFFSAIQMQPGVSLTLKTHTGPITFQDQTNRVVTSNGGAISLLAGVDPGAHADLTVGPIIALDGDVTLSAGQGGGDVTANHGTTGKLISVSAANGSIAVNGFGPQNTHAPGLTTIVSTLTVDAGRDVAIGDAAGEGFATATVHAGRDISTGAFHTFVGLDVSGGGNVSVGTIEQPFGQVAIFAGGALSTSWVDASFTPITMTSGGPMSVGQLLTATGDIRLRSGGAMSTGTLLTGTGSVVLSAGGALSTGFLGSGLGSINASSGGAISTPNIDAAFGDVVLTSNTSQISTGAIVSRSTPGSPAAHRDDVQFFPISFTTRPPGSLIIAGASGQSITLFPQDERVARTFNDPVPPTPSNPPTLTPTPAPQQTSMPSPVPTSPPPAPSTLPVPTPAPSLQPPPTPQPSGTAQPVPAPVARGRKLSPEEKEKLAETIRAIDRADREREANEIRIPPPPPSFSSDAFDGRIGPACGIGQRAPSSTDDDVDRACYSHDQAYEGLGTNIFSTVDSEAADKALVQKLAYIASDSKQSAGTRSKATSVMALFVAWKGYLWMGKVLGDKIGL